MTPAECLTKHQGLIISIARRLAFRYRLDAHLDDMIAFGQKGILQALERFDTSRGLAFSTFAFYRIQGAMLDGARAMGWVRRRRRAQSHAEQVFNDQQQTRFDDSPSPQDDLSAIARDLDESITHAAFIFLLSEDASLDSADAEHNLSPDARLEQEQTASLLRGLVQRLPPDDRAIIEMTFFQDLSTEEIGQALGCSKSWACRRRQAALDRLRGLWLEAA
jgi:RNA polymerase sigma factor for flagellar operon FliA